MTLIHGTAAPELPARVVVVGAGGFIGGAIADRLAAAGAEVAALTRMDVDLLSEGAAERLADLLAPEDAVVAASAIAPVKTPAMLVDNIRLIETLAEALGRRPVAYLLNIGSDAVFADSAGLLCESSCRSPGSLHGVMHLTRELMLAEAAGETPFATLRPTLVYGAGDPHNGYGPNQFRRKAAAGQPIALFGEGEERRDHILVDDVAELAARMVLRRSRGALNAVTGRVATFREIAERVAALAAETTGRPVAIESRPRSGPMPHNGYRAFDPAAIRAAFPDLTPTSIEDGLARAEAIERRAEPAERRAVG